MLTLNESNKAVWDSCKKKTPTISGGIPINQAHLNLKLGTVLCQFCMQPTINQQQIQWMLTLRSYLKCILYPRGKRLFIITNLMFFPPHCWNMNSFIFIINICNSPWLQKVIKTSVFNYCRLRHVKQQPLPGNSTNQKTLATEFSCSDSNSERKWWKCIATIIYCYRYMYL